MTSDRSDVEAREHALVRALLRRVAHARVDPSAFFELVMREETTRERLSTQPHQRLVLEFVMAHQHCVIRMPIGFSKTYLMTALTLFFLGQDPTSRGLLLSATQTQAEKPFSVVRDMIEGASPELRLVFPALVPSRRTGDHWTQSRIVVDRPAGIRDPSLVALGVGGALPGSRLSWAVVDDVLDMENTATPAARHKLHRWFESTCMSRLDLRGSRMVVTNTPWVGPSPNDAGDLTYVLESAGWPSLTMSAYGDITIRNAPTFDSALIRPGEGAAGPEDPHRLVPHDAPEVLAAAYPDGRPPDPTKDVEEVVPLWPEKFPLDLLEAERRKYMPREFGRLYEMKARSEADDRIQEAWVQTAKTEAIRLGHRAFATGPVGDYPVVAGCDVGVGRTERSARSAIFTFAVLPDRRRLVLDVQAGRWSGPELVSRIIATHERYGAIVRVENNAAQDFVVQWTRERRRDVPVRAHTTGRNKGDPRHGVESIFIELEQGAWLFPSDIGGRSPAVLEEAIQALRQYEPPPAHTADLIMAWWLAREQARRQGLFTRIHADSRGLGLYR